jgi:3-oxoacyl-[acyl-carrier protein] reductase
MLTGQIALVTGASRGIGSEIAKHLAKEGAYVVINFSGNELLAKEVLKDIQSNGGNGEVYKCNVSEYQEVKIMIEYIVKNHNKIDIIINNAGITRDNLLLKMTENDFDEVININLKGAFNTAKNAVRYMLKQRSGRIVNISSISGIIGNAGQLNYSAAKAGLIGMTKSLAREVASRGITVNAVAPGFIETNMTDILSETVRKTIKEKIPLNKFGQSVDIANMVVFLVSDKANYITGQVMEVNGGMNM